VAEAASTGLSPEDAVAVLRAGNHRFAGGEAVHPRQDRARRQHVASGQAPVAVVVSCIDSRVPPEIVFDCGLGDILSVRTAAHVCDEVVLGSVEFGPAVLGTPLIMVLGHRDCGAARAAVGAFERDEWPPGHIQDVVAALRPAYQAAPPHRGPETVEGLIRAHIALTVAHLKAERALAAGVSSGRLGIVGAYYDLDTGAVQLIA
jgi:carbonic anhydrase